MEAATSTEEDDPPAEEAVSTPEEPKPIPDTPKGRVPAKRAGTKTDFKELGRDLSPEQLQEWQAIYASYRFQSILTGKVTGLDTNSGGV